MIGLGLMLIPAWLELFANENDDEEHQEEDARAIIRRKTQEPPDYDAFDDSDDS